MKCPCCGEIVDAPFIVTYNVLHLPDGTSHRVNPSALKILMKLTKGPLRRPSGRTAVFDQHMHILRTFFKAVGLPYHIAYVNPDYYLRSNVS